MIPKRAASADPRPNLILVVLDTVRVDHVSAYGYDRRTTPFLDRLAAEGTLFAKARSASPWTHASHATMFTGLLPSGHGARYAGAGHPGGPRGSAVLPMRPDVPSLPGLLGEAGYDTIGGVGAALLSPGLGVTRGFARFSAADPRVETRASAVAANVLKLVDGRDDARRPVWVFANFFDAHGPYEAHPDMAPWIDRAKGLSPVDFLARVQGVPRFARLSAGLETLSEAEWQRARDFYDSEITVVDRGLQTLFKGLRARGLLQKSLVIVTSDHGEYFGEHGGMADHGRTLFEPLLRVPLVLWGHGIPAGKRVDAPVSLADVFGTFAVAAGLQANQAGCDLAALAQGKACRSGPVVAEAFSDPALAPVKPDLFGRDHIALVDWPLKTMRDSAGQTRLFDIAADPAEAHDVSKERKADADRLSLLIDAWQKDHPRHVPPPSDVPAGPGPLTIERLKALGYVE